MNGTYRVCVGAVRTILLVLVASTAASAQPTSVSTQPTLHRFDDAWHIALEPGGHVKETDGVFVSDTDKRELRFEVNGDPVFSIPYHRLTALHYESWRRPVRYWALRPRYLRAAGYFFAIHYLDEGGVSREQTIRLPDREALALLALLPTDAGMSVDLTDRQQSFLGIPIRVTIGDRVVVRDSAGRKVTGTITDVSPSSIALAGPRGQTPMFAAADVKSIRLPFRPGPAALEGLVIGAALGTWLGLQTAQVTGAGGRAVFGGAAAMAGFEATLFVALGAALHPVDRSKDIYRAPASGKAGALRLVPELSRGRKAVHVAVKF